jgi:putative NIF3 family GTP cyclohydrolase 1 type 2
MQAQKLYQQLEKDFITAKMHDKWVEYMSDVKDFLSKNFLKREMGLVCDFTEEINKVYTAVFPSKNVLKRIINDEVKEAMLFVHHPMIWDVTQNKIFYNMSSVLLKELKDAKVSIYNLHSPLDNFGEYSTSDTLAASLNLTSIKPFSLYEGGVYGAICKSNSKTLADLKTVVEKSVGHAAKMYPYGDSNIDGKEIAVGAGGGTDINVLRDMLSENVKTLVTGVSTRNNNTKEAHEFAEKNKINIIGATHYSTEKFACIAMVKYFEKLGLPAEFIPEEPLMKDL